MIVVEHLILPMIYFHDMHLRHRINGKSMVNMLNQNLILLNLHLSFQI